MAAHSPLIDALVQALRVLPGVGPKSAQRMAYHLLERNREGGRALGRVLGEAMERVGHCRRCRTLSETELCPLCASGTREQAVLCVVETPSDVHAIEQATDYRGLYFVLGGHLSPLDGIGPRDLGIEDLEKRLAADGISEVILATNPTVEGDATAHFIAELAARHGIAASRIAHGVPIGGELEYVDGGTLSHAFSGRRPV